MGPITIEKDDKDKLPPRANAGEWAPWGAPSRPALIDWRIAAVIAAFLLVAGWLIAPSVRDWLAEGWGASVARWAVWGGLGLAGLAAAKRVLLVEQPGGFRVPIWQVDARPVVRGMIEVQHAYASNQTRNVAALTLTNPAPAALMPPVEEAEVVAIGPDVGPLARDRWLEWLDSRPHAMFAGQTGAGKSTVAKAGLKRRIADGEQVLVIDPHANGWFDLPGVGGGENWRQVEEAMRAVIVLYHERQQERERFIKEAGRELPHNHFPRLTVVFDEANDAYEHFRAAYNGARKHTSPWQPFAVTLSSGARKVGISVWLLVQSPNVEDLGMSGPKRENFTRFALDPRSIGMMIDHDERSQERRRALNAAVAGMQYPATVCVDSEVYLLDRAGLNTIAPPANSSRAAWDGWDYANGRPARAVALPAPAWPAYCDVPWKQIAFLAKTTTMTQRDIRAAVGCDMNLVNNVVGRVRRTTNV